MDLIAMDAGFDIKAEARFEKFFVGYRGKYFLNAKANNYLAFYEIPLRLRVFASMLRAETWRWDGENMVPGGIVCPLMVFGPASECKIDEAGQVPGRTDLQFVDKYEQTVKKVFTNRFYLHNLREQT